MLSLYLYGAAAGAIVLLALGGAAFHYFQESKQTVEAAVTMILDETDDEDPLTFRPPEIKNSILDVLRVTRHLQRQRKLAKKGYVKWYRLGSTLGRPQWVKPKQQGSGTPKVTVDGQPYYFEPEAMVSDEVTGAWVAMHREGEADLMNLRDPAYPGIEADLMERIINLEAEDKPPGWLDGLGNWDQKTMMYVGIVVLFLIYAAYRYMGGGL